MVTLPTVLMPVQFPAPPARPTPAAPGAPVVAGAQEPGVAFTAPNEIYQAARAARNELQGQMDRLKEERSSIASRLRNQGSMANAADTKGLENRLAQIDSRITALDKQIADQDAAVAKAAAIPGAVTIEPPRDRSGPPEEVFALGAMFMLVVLLPISIAWARRIWRRGAAVVTALPQEVYDRFTRLEQSLDSIAIEVERVGEGQRFLTKMQSEQQGRALGAGPAAHVDVGDRERERQELRRK